MGGLFPGRSHHAGRGARARGAAVPGRLLGSLLAIAPPEDSVADYVAACRARGRRPFLDGPHFEGLPA
jgi:hypothetical protein